MQTLFCIFVKLRINFLPSCPSEILINGNDLFCRELVQFSGVFISEGCNSNLQNRSGSSKAVQLDLFQVS